VSAASRRLDQQVPIFEQLRRPNGREQCAKDTTRIKPRLLLFGGLDGVKSEKVKDVFRANFGRNGKEDC